MHVPGPNSSWINAIVVDILEDSVRVDTRDGAQVVKKDDIKLQNPESLLMASNVIHLPHLHEPGVLDTIVQRYTHDNIYTLSGSILIAVNPYKTLSEHYYSNECIDKYHGQDNLAEIDPHVYSIAEQAYRSLRRDQKSQSILVSGESGAGKTGTKR